MKKISDNRISMNFKNTFEITVEDVSENRRYIIDGEPNPDLTLVKGMSKL